MPTLDLAGLLLKNDNISGQQPQGGAVSLQIFLSYSRKDDLLPPHMSVGKGFVTCLREQLLYEFSQRGAPEPTIWRDKRSLERGDQFDPIIREAIESSAIFLVVLSPNWMSRPYCKQELDLFKQRWQHIGEMGVKQRIVVVCKSHVDRDRRPSLLQGQEGYDFFKFEDPERTGQQIDFFARGEIRDQQYHDTIEELAGFLYRRAQHMNRHDEQVRSDIEEREEAFVRTRNRVRQAKPRPDQDARKVYLAKPASDTREVYCQLVEELSRKGFAIFPDPDMDIPNNASATSFVDTALATADVSIHLLGEGEGYTPEKSEPIVRLQLARAARKLAAPQSNGFRRIIWAPKLLEDEADPADPGHEFIANTTKQHPTAGKREPREVLARFGDYHPTDKLLGDGRSTFVDFILEHLIETNSPRNDIGTLTPDNWVYIFHEKVDAKYAKELTKALRNRGIIANLPATEGDPAALRRFHRKSLVDCSAVVVCWAEASEVWAKGRARELNWRKLGRSGKFAYRGLFAAPPPGDRKAEFVELPPRNEIDIIVDMTRNEQPIAEAIEPFVHLAQPDDQ